MNHATLRKTLVEAIDKVISGALSPDKATAIAKLAAAATNSLQAEINAIQAMRGLGLQPVLPAELAPPPAIESTATREEESGDDPRLVAAVTPAPPKAREPGEGLTSVAGARLVKGRGGY